MCTPRSGIVTAAFLTVLWVLFDRFDDFVPFLTIFGHFHHAGQFCPVLETLGTLCVHTKASFLKSAPLCTCCAWGGGLDGQGPGRACRMGLSTGWCRSARCSATASTPAMVVMRWASSGPKGSTAPLGPSRSASRTTPAALLPLCATPAHA